MAKRTAKQDNDALAVPPSAANDAEAASKNDPVAAQGSQIAAYVEGLRGLPLTTLDEAGVFADYVKKLKAAAKRLNDDRMEQTRPLDESKKLTMSRYKPLLDRIDAAVKESLDRLGTFAHEEAERRKAAGDLSEALRIKGPGGASFTAKPKRTWFIAHSAQVPPAYWTVDTKKVEAAVEAGLLDDADWIEVAVVDEYALR